MFDIVENDCGEFYFEFQGLRLFGYPNKETAKMKLDRFNRRIGKFPKAKQAVRLAAKIRLSYEERDYIRWMIVPFLKDHFGNSNLDLIRHYYTEFYRRVSK